jgi:hypothetical protein
MKIFSDEKSIEIIIITTCSLNILIIHTIIAKSLKVLQKVS